MKDELKNFIGKTVLIFCKGTEKTFTYKGLLVDVQDSFAIIDDFKSGSVALLLANVLSIQEVKDG